MGSKLRFNPAPGWPAPDDPSWLPPAGWQPDPSWPPAPAGWKTVVDARPWPARHKVLTGVGALFVVGAIATAAGGGNSEKVDVTLDSPAASAAAASTPSKAPATPTKAAPTKALSPTEQLAAAIDHELGKPNRKGVKRVQGVDLSDGQLVVTYAMDDNLTKGFIKDGAYSDTGKVLKLVQASGIKATSLVVQGTLELQDKLGNSVGEKPVVTISFDQNALQHANVDNLPGKLILNAADEVAIRHDILG